ncbi:MAG: hypothetical protein AXA67_11920 [Methylothermaceae bacteria B42]|nr:MAG: hypothetical protein AXA67_11920 [Methylothermaceae bacteria B42]HHJ39237.1 glycosyltransferase family 1 protein [Methylothermaceae bacterium]
MMRVVIVHYHLRPGGVTRVIAHAATELMVHGASVVVLASGDLPQDFPCPVRQVPALAYDEGGAAVSPDQLQRQMDMAVRDALGGEADLWHIHNHSLGKNLALPVTVANMARAGRRILLQIHDFPEDFRSYNYRRLRDFIPLDQFAETLYPQAPQVQYCVLNGRDRRFLAKAGVAEERLHTLANPVWMPQAATEDIPNWPYRLWLYPTRAIRRKNIGEWLLWSALAGPEDRFATSLAPENPREQQRYRQWVGLAKALNLPVSFDLATQTQLSFATLLRSAYCLGTTSVAEGFGMAFLEPWLLDRPVAGRNLPEITQDFDALGVALSHLYTRLPIPLDFFEVGEIASRLRRALTQLYGDYRLPPPGEAELQRAWDAWVQEDQVDFGCLDEDLQAKVIRHLCHHPHSRNALSMTQLTVAANEVISHNRRVIQENYSLSAYGERLMAIYQGLLAASPGPVSGLDCDTLLRCFLQPERLNLLRL